MIIDQVSRVKPAPHSPLPRPPRRTPQQSRSRERVTTILEAARRLIGSRGNDAVSVREIAAAAGVPIGSVYQYFHDKNAILRELIASHLAAVRAAVVRAFAGVRRPEDLPRASVVALDGLVALFAGEPQLATIWAGVQANTVLRELDAQDSREIAGHLAGVLRRALPRVARREIEGVCLFAAHVPSSAVRIALGLDPADRRRLLHELETVVLLRMSELVARNRRAGARPRPRRPAHPRS